MTKPSNSAIASTSTSSKKDELIKAVTERLNADLATSEPLGRTVVRDLLSHFPLDIRDDISVDTLVHISTVAIKVVTEVMTTASAIAVVRECTNDCIYWWIAVEDRPFIINTITEAFAAHNALLMSLVHPIVRHQGRAVSLSLVQTELLSENEIEILSQDIRSSLEKLTLISNDFAPMLMECESLTSRLRALNDPKAQEISEFLSVLADGGFVFLGYSGVNRSAIDKSSTPGGLLDISLGVCKLADSELAQALSHDRKRLEESAEIHLISRLPLKSAVHRRIRMVSLSVKERGERSYDHIFIGIPTSKLRALQSSQVPIIRRKLREMLEREAAVPNAYYYKSIVNFVDNMPKDDALRLEVPALLEAVRSTLVVFGRQDTKVAILGDATGTTATVVVAMPRDRFTAEMRRRLQRQIENAFNATPGSSEYTLDVSDKAVARFYISVPTTPEQLKLIDRTNLSNVIAGLTKTWTERFDDALRADLRVAQLGTLSKQYRGVFGDDYQALHTPNEAVEDLLEFSKLSVTCSVRVSFHPLVQGIGVSIYSVGNEIYLSKALPVLENSGFEILTERAIHAEHPILGRVYIYKFQAKLKCLQSVDLAHLQSNVAPGLESVLSGKSSNDPLNQLLLLTSLDLSALAVLRTYAGLLSQVNKFATRHAIYHALVAVPQCATILWNAFVIKFDPQLSVTAEQRNVDVNKLLDGYIHILTSVKDISQDRILRGLATVIRYTLRTNFYLGSETIALKLHSESIDFMPLPRPKYEIYVNGPTVEGVHLRSSKVSRGGIRWSDRRDDYRTEVLGLMKTQKIKNSVIVPGGAKGGFIVKQPPENPAEFRAAGELCYSTYVRALLSVSDNIVDGSPVTPTNIVRHDELDPYLVVAADKGTATFSDIANRIAQNEYNFWLDDAFASGGSFGYDHKKYGITARGAWECAKRHFKDLGINFEDSAFSVVGIGDMSGDVFGNGLILSKNMKLVGAFDHRSIFIDPDPDTSKSHEERTRLFNLKGSSWFDYDSKLISEGGGVWSRNEKEISLSSAARRALGLGEDLPQAMSGETVIQCILRAPVDLLWNGGIGTYVKASFESHSDANDSSNDSVRVSADELRCRVVAEGGNLGFTQEARRQFSLRAGRINTDAIDNSGGVDLSDHEVNIKIALSRAMLSGRLTRDARNQLLKQIAEEVVDAVLRHNRSQALALSLGERRSRKNTFFFKPYLRDLSKLGYISRVADKLPDDEELDDRGMRKVGLLRPELALILSAAKMYTKDILIESDIPDDGTLTKYLLGYFPPVLRERFAEDIKAHPLARNITAGELANTLVDNFGMTFFHRMSQHHGISIVSVVKCSIAAEIILGFGEVREALWQYDTLSHREAFMRLNLDMTRGLRATASWLMSAHGETKSVQQLTELYSKSFIDIAANPEEVLVHDEATLYTRALAAGTHAGFDQKLSKHFALLSLIVPILETVSVSHQTGATIPAVSRIYSHLLTVLKLRPFVMMVNSSENISRWENEVRVSSFEDIRRGISSIARNLIDIKKTSADEITEVLTRSPSYSTLSNILLELETQKTPGAAALAVVAKHVRSFSMPTTTLSVQNN